MTASFGSLLTAMVTPFDVDLNVDYDRAAALAKLLVSEGSDGLVVAATTGESPTLSHDEKVRLVAIVKEAVGDSVPVIANTGTNSTAAGIEMTRDAEKVGCDGIMLVTPYYNKPSQEGLYRHFRTTAEATSLPVILYNVPSRTCCAIKAETIIRLARDVPNIRGLKEASGDFTHTAAVSQQTPEDFMIYSGNDADTLHLLALGGIGVISVVSHVAGPEMKEMIDAFHAGDVARSRAVHLQLLPLIASLFPPTSANPVAVKAAMRMRNFDCGGLRLPLVDADDGECEAIRSALRCAGLRTCSESELRA